MPRRTRAGGESNDDDEENSTSEYEEPNITAHQAKEEPDSIEAPSSQSEENAGDGHESNGRPREVPPRKGHELGRPISGDIIYYPRYPRKL